MANKRSLECSQSGYRVQEVLAIGQEGSFKDLETKISHCFTCENNLGCKGLNTYLKQLSQSQENFNYLKDKIKQEQNLN